MIETPGSDRRVGSSRLSSTCNNRLALNSTGICGLDSHSLMYSPKVASSSNATFAPSSCRAAIVELFPVPVKPSMITMANLVSRCFRSRSTTCVLNQPAWLRKDSVARVLPFSPSLPRWNSADTSSCEYYFYAGNLICNVVNIPVAVDLVSHEAPRVSLGGSTHLAPD